MKKRVLRDIAINKDFKNQILNYRGTHPLLGHTYQSIFGPKPTSAWTVRYLEAGGYFATDQNDWMFGFSHREAATLEMLGVSPVVAAEYEQSNYFVEYFSIGCFDVKKMKPFFEDSSLETPADLDAVFEALWYISHEVA